MKKYSSNKPERVTIKYIFTDENYNLSELDAFIKNCEKYSLINCCFQISLNFKKDKIPYNILKSIIYLYGSLLSFGVNKIFIDDHIMFRLTELDEKTYNNIKIFVSIKIWIYFLKTIIRITINNFWMRRDSKTMIDKSRYLKIITIIF